MTFPVDHFRWHVACALIAADYSQRRYREGAWPEGALEAAALDHSGFRYHPTVGLVMNQYDDLVQG